MAWLCILHPKKETLAVSENRYLSTSNGYSHKIFNVFETSRSMLRRLERTFASDFKVEYTQHLRTIHSIGIGLANIVCIHTRIVKTLYTYSIHLTNLINTKIISSWMNDVSNDFFSLCTCTQKNKCSDFFKFSCKGSRKGECCLH